MKATVLIDNRIDDQSDLCSEWGLSILIEYGEHTILLDTGKTGMFVENAEKLSIDLKKVDFGVLSHAHYDHANGLERFFETNQKAKFYLRDKCAENCFKRTGFTHKYIGIQKGVLSKFKNRIEYVEGDYEIIPGCFLIPHKVDSSFPKGNMRVKKGIRWCVDKFEHEQSLVFKTEKGLIIFNSCSHTGADSILKEVKMTFPNESIYAIIGGFHLRESVEEKAPKLAKGILESGVLKVYTGHCTCDEAYELLKVELKDKLYPIKTGLVMEF